MKTSSQKDLIIEAWYQGEAHAELALADCLEETGFDNPFKISWIRKGHVWLGMEVNSYEEIENIPDACVSGWAVCECDGSENGPWQLQAIYDEDRFNTDQEAWAYVWWLALKRNREAVSSLAFLAQHNWMEYDQIFQAMIRGNPGDPGAYMIGSVGRSTDDVMGTNNHGRQIVIRAESLWRVTQTIHDGGDGEWLPHYVMVLLADDTRDVDPRGISYEGACYGLLELEPARLPEDEGVMIHDQ